MPQKCAGAIRNPLRYILHSPVHQFHLLILYNKLFIGSFDLDYLPLQDLYRNINGKAKHYEGSRTVVLMENGAWGCTWCRVLIGQSREGG